MRVVVDTNIFVSAFLKDKSLPAMAVRLGHSALLALISSTRPTRAASTPIL